MAGLKPGSDEYKWTTKMIENLEKDLKKYEEEGNHEWLWRTEVRLQFFKEKLTGKEW